MKVCIFFDGQNFYRSLQRFDDNLRVDYDRLAAWITQAVGGSGALFGGAYYYVGVSPDAPQVVEGFLKGLELRPGYFVRREPRVRRSVRCPHCGQDYDYTTEKRVDTRLVADLIHHAANDNFDAAVLVSGDDDFVPAVEAVNALGKQVWVATWSAEELSSDLRVRCFGHIQLSEGLGAFRADRLPRDRERGVSPLRVEGRGPRPVSRLAPMGARVSAATALERGVSELQRAEARLPHVSRGY
ncbi:MAG TPA: NYN domain-containing protein, partial [Nevskiaceae bacterium]|nr:NYN domain-containing protein [Nevskiaceae bacterium]